MKKNVIITGATGGIGKALAREMANQQYDVILACRNPAKAGQVFEELKTQLAPDNAAHIEVLTLDLASLDSVKQFVQNIAQRPEPVSLLLNNAGILDTYTTRSQDGYPLMMAVNFIGTALLTLALLPYLAPEARIFNMVSSVYKIGRGDGDFFSRDIHPPRWLGKIQAYADSKLANLLFVQALAQELEANGSLIRINGVDPGIVDTGMITMHAWFDTLADILFRPLIRSPQQGAHGMIYFSQPQHLTGINGALLKDEKQQTLPAWVKAYPDSKLMLTRLRQLGQETGILV